MGRTVPTYRMIIERITVALAPFRRALREQDRLAFDRLMNRVRDRASAASFLVEESPLESALVAALVGHEREIQRLREEIAELRDGSAGRCPQTDPDEEPHGVPRVDGGRMAAASPWDGDLHEERGHPPESPKGVSLPGTFGSAGEPRRSPTKTNGGEQRTRSHDGEG